VKALGSSNGPASIVLFALASTSLWTACSSSDSPAAQRSPDAAAPSDAGTTELDATDGTPPCNESFCRFALPDVSGVALNASWAVSASDVWVGGSGGYAAHFDGTTWTRVATGTKAAIFGITAGADGTVWGANGGYTLLKLNRPTNGVAENVNASTNAIFDGISVAGSAVFIAGATTGQPSDPILANIWRYGANPEGGAPKVIPISPPCPGHEEPGERCVRLHAVWAESSERQWFVGEGGRAYVTDTSPPPDGDNESVAVRLIEMNSGSLRTLNAIWGFGPNDIWAVGTQGVIRHWTGGNTKTDAWQSVPSPVTHDLHSLWGSRPDDIWAVGAEGTVIHWDGTSWTQREIPYARDRRPRFYTVSAAGDDVWIGGMNAFLRSNHTRAER
jgi:hypothetical protein